MIVYIDVLYAVFIAEGLFWKKKQCQRLYQSTYQILYQMNAKNNYCVMLFLVNDVEAQAGHPVSFCFVQVRVSGRVQKRKCIFGLFEVVHQI
jgi:hypothetical protein